MVLSEAPCDVAERSYLGLLELIGPDQELVALEDMGLLALRDFMTHRLRAGLATPEHTAAVATILTSVDAAIRADLAQRLQAQAKAFDPLSRVIRAITAPTGSLPGIVTRELCHALGYSKAMFSLVSGSCWAPVSASVNPALTGDFGRFVRAVDGHRIDLREAPREAELVRRRRPYAIGPREIHRDTYRPLLDLSRSAAYLAVPVVVDARTVAIMHVDRHHTELSDADFHLVGALAEVCALSQESAELRTRISEQNQRTESELERLARELSCLEQSTVTIEEIAARPRMDNTPAGPIVGERALPLTARERDVFALLATGATNAIISRRLCISDGTVKSHVQRIFRKLGIATRAQAAALYASHRTPLGASA